MGIWLCAYCTEQARDYGALGPEMEEAWDGEEDWGMAG